RRLALRLDLDPFPRRPRGWERNRFAIDPIGNGDPSPGSGMIDCLLYGLERQYDGTSAARRNVIIHIECPGGCKGKLIGLGAHRTLDQRGSITRKNLIGCGRQEVEQTSDQTSILDVHERMPLPPFGLPTLTVEQLCPRWQPGPTDGHANRFDVGDKLD